MSLLLGKQLVHQIASHASIFGSSSVKIRSLALRCLWQMTRRRDRESSSIQSNLLDIIENPYRGVAVIVSPVRSHLHSTYATSKEPPPLSFVNNDNATYLKFYIFLLNLMLNHLLSVRLVCTSSPILSTKISIVIYFFDKL